MIFDVTIIIKNFYFTCRCSWQILLFNHSFIHSFILAISITPLQVHYYSEAPPNTARILYRCFTPKRTGNCNKGLAQGPYVAARAAVEPTTLRLRVIDLTNAPKVFASSEERVLLTMLPAEQNNCSHRTADFR